MRARIAIAFFGAGLISLGFQPETKVTRGAKNASRCCRPAGLNVRYTPAHSSEARFVVGRDEAYVRRAESVDGQFVLTIDYYWSFVPDFIRGYKQTADGGRTWTKAIEMPSNLNILGSPLEGAPSHRKVIYRIYQSLDFLYLRSDDGGDNWALPAYRINGLSREDFAISVARSSTYHVEFNLSAIDPRDPLTIYATIRVVPWANSLVRLRPFSDFYVPGMYISHDGGENWAKFSNELGNGTPLGISPRDPDLMYGFGTRGVIKSSDRGRSWTPVGEENVLLRSIGFSYETKAQQEKREKLGEKGLEIREFLFDPKNDDVVYFVSNKGVYRTMDGGHTWCLLNVGFDEVDAINSLAVNGLNPNEIFVGTIYGIFKSTDRGCHFEKVYPPNSKTSRSRRGTQR